MMTPNAIKALPVWGAQNGLLSVAELDALMHVVRNVPFGYVSVLEVGHYYGLSTCALVHALRAHPCGAWSMTTLDAHIADAWVPETPPDVFFNNKRAHFDSPRLSVLIANSESIQRIDGYNVVFYDGDHAAEQQRFTELVLDSPSVDLFIFDDRDFAVPRVCCEMLRAAGWLDASPPLRRVPGGADKADPSTMTLGIFWRPRRAHQ